MLKTISLLIAAILAFSVPAAAQNRCFPREVVMIQLADRYHETRQSIGLTGDGKLVEMWAGETGSWTATVTEANGMTCIVAACQSFQAFPKKPNL